MSLTIYPPASTGGGALTLATVTVDATVGTKQNFLAAVGASTNQVPVDFIVSNASQSLALITGGAGVQFGYVGDADVAIATVSTITNSNTNVRAVTTVPSITGTSGDVLGVIVDPVLTNLPIVVAGAGTAAANATYAYSGTANGKNEYTQPTAGTITWDGIDRWKISDGDPFWYYSLDDVATPDLCTTWVADVDGSNPVPTVTEGANPTFDIDVFYYDVAI